MRFMNMVLCSQQCYFYKRSELQNPFKNVCMYVCVSQNLLLIFETRLIL